jgi:hypothetical protein
LKKGTGNVAVDQRSRLRPPRKNQKLRLIKILAQ